MPTSLADAPITAAPLAVVDVETTGLSPARGDRVVEVGVLLCEGASRIERTVSTLCNPGFPLDPRVVAIHGITDEMLRDAPPFSGRAAELASILADRVIVGHNVRFDLGFLAAEFGRAGVAFEPGPILDTLALARTVAPQGRCGLGALAARLGVTVTGAHRALADARTTWEVLRILLERSEEGNARTRTVGELMELQQRAPDRRAPRRPVDTGQLARWDRQARALLERRRVAVLYRNAFGQTGWRTIRPLAWSAPYLRAWCELRCGERTFRIDRILESRPVS